MTISAATATRFARLTLRHVAREYPHKADHVMGSADDAYIPSRVHPAFYGSFDWHSCVHGWWQLLTIARLHPALAEAAEIRARADETLTAEKIAAELAYVARPQSAGFERPYGWGWLLALHAEAARHAAPWGDALAPLAHAFANRFEAYLPRLTYPIRTGVHSSTAFALVLALDWARRFRPSLADLIAARVQHWFGGDKGAQAWEPSGDDFLSPTLIEAMLMSRVAGTGFADWFDAFLPDAASEVPGTLFAPAIVSDRTDGKIAHLDGLNLSRAWCWRGIAAALPGHPAICILEAAAERHLAASLPHVEGDYMGEHWLASFALLALSPAGDAGRG